MFLKVSKGTIAYDTSFAKSIVPFASTIATFRGRSFEPAVVVLYENFHMGISGDAQIELQREHESRNWVYALVSLNPKP